MAFREVFILRLFGTGLIQGQDDLIMELHPSLTGGQAVDLARMMAKSLARGSIEVMTRSNMIVAKFHCWQWENV